MTHQDLHTGLAIIRKDFNLSESEFSLAESEITAQKLLKKLSALVESLINRDFGLLLQVLYRIDIPEDKLKAALVSDQGTPSELIAQMIFEREMQKVETRKRFSSQ